MTLASRRWFGVLGVCAIGASAGCGGGSGLGKPVVLFPSRQDLESVAARDAKPVANFGTVSVERWEIRAKTAFPGQEFAPSTAWDRMLIETVQSQKRPVRLAPELACTAEETARFYLEHAGYPDDGLRGFLLARCGSTLPGASFSAFEGTVADATSDDDLASQARSNFEQLLAHRFADGMTEIGVGYARANGRFAVVAYGGRPRVQLHGFSPLVTSAGIVLQGELPRDAKVVIGLANQGPYGVLPCEPDRTQRWPRFRLSCPVSESDTQTLIELATRNDEHVLMTPVLQVLALRSDEAGLVYESPPSSAQAGDPASFARSLLESLNAARRATGAGPLTLETAQSKANERLAPHLFEAMFREDAERADMVALGALAGWDVAGTIRTGGVFSGFLASSRSPERFVGQALESPLGRWVLLEPGMSRVAIGSGALPPTGVMALITTYAFFGGHNHDADETAVFDELTKARAARGLPAPARAGKSAALRTALNRIATQSRTTGDALSDALTTISANENRSVSGWILETSDLEHLPFSDALLGKGALEVAVGVTHYKAPGAAWGQYAVLVVIFDGSFPVRTQQANLHPAARPRL